MPRGFGYDELGLTGYPTSGLLPAIAGGMSNLFRARSAREEEEYLKRQRPLDLRHIDLLNQEMLQRMQEQASLLPGRLASQNVLLSLHGQEAAAMQRQAEEEKQTKDYLSGLHEQYLRNYSSLGAPLSAVSTILGGGPVTMGPPSEALADVPFLMSRGLAGKESLGLTPGEFVRHQRQRAGLELTEEQKRSHEVRLQIARQQEIVHANRDREHDRQFELRMSLATKEEDRRRLEFSYKRVKEASGSLQNLYRNMINIPPDQFPWMEQTAKNDLMDAENEWRAVLAERPAPEPGATAAAEPKLEGADVPGRMMSPFEGVSRPVEAAPVTAAPVGAARQPSLREQVEQAKLGESQQRTLLAKALLSSMGLKNEAIANTIATGQARTKFEIGRLLMQGGLSPTVEMINTVFDVMSQPRPDASAFARTRGSRAATGEVPPAQITFLSAEKQKEQHRKNLTVKLHQMEADLTDKNKSDNEKAKIAEDIRIARHELGIPDPQKKEVSLEVALKQRLNTLVKHTTELSTTTPNEWRLAELGNIYAAKETKLTIDKIENMKYTGENVRARDKLVRDLVATIIARIKKEQDAIKEQQKAIGEGRARETGKSGGSIRPAY